jgi:hypothetical protein
MATLCAPVLRNQVVEPCRGKRFDARRVDVWDGTASASSRFECRAHMLGRADPLVVLSAGRRFLTTGQADDVS